MAELTEEQKLTFECIRTVRPNEICLISGEFQGNAVAYLCVTENRDGSVLLHPLGLITDNAFVERHFSEMLLLDAQKLEPK